MRKLLLFPLILVTSAISLAVLVANSTPAVSTPSKPAIEQVNAGELRLDGKISAMLGPGLWQLDAISWTSPRGITTNFDDVKPKAAQLAPDAFIHPLGETTPVPLTDIKLQSPVAIIGKNGADGTVLVREVILLEGYGKLKTVGILPCNSESLHLIDESRHARDVGQLAKALELAKRAADTAEAQGDLTGEALTTQDIAILYKQLKQNNDSLESFKRVQALGDQLNNPLAQVMGLEGQGNILGDMNQNDLAIALLERAAAFGTTTPALMQISVLEELASVYSHANKWTEATGALTRLFPLQEKSGEYDDATVTLLMMASEQSPLDITAAKSSLEQARARMDNIHDDSKRLTLTVMLASALKLTNDLTGAAAQYEVAAKLATAQGNTQDAARYQAFAINPAASTGPELGGDWTTLTPSQKPSS